MLQNLTDKSLQMIQILIVSIFSITDLGQTLISNGQKYQKQSYFNMGFSGFIIFICIIILIYFLLKKNDKKVQSIAFIMVSITLMEQYIFNNKQQMMHLCLSLILIQFSYKTINIVSNSRILNVLLVQLIYTEVRNIIGKNGIDLYTSLQLGITLAFIYVASITNQVEYKMDSIIDNINEYNNQNSIDNQPQIILNCIQQDKKNQPRLSSPSINYHNKVLDQNTDQIQYAQDSQMDDSKCYIKKQQNSKSNNQTEFLNIPKFQYQQAIQSNNFDKVKMNQIGEYLQFFQTGLTLIDENQNIIFKSKNLENIINQYGLVKDANIKNNPNFQQSGSNQKLFQINLKFDYEEEEQKLQKMNVEKIQSNSNISQKDFLNINQQSNSQNIFENFQTNTEEGNVEIQIFEKISNNKNQFTFENDQNDDLLNQQQDLNFKMKNENFDGLFEKGQNCNQLSFFSDSQEMRQQQIFLNNLEQLNLQSAYPHFTDFHSRVLSSSNQQCDIKTATQSFFQRYNQTASLEDLINFIILQKPNPIVSNCSELFLLEPHEQVQSPLAKKFGKNKKFISQNSSDFAYKYSFVDDYLVLTLNRKNQQNKTSLIEIRVGCFQLEDQPKEKSNNANNTHKSIQSLTQNPNNNSNKINNQLQEIKFVSSSQINLQEQDKAKRSSLPAQKASGFYYQKSKDQFNQNNFAKQNLNEKIKYFFTLEIIQISSQFKQIVKKQVNQQKSNIFKQISYELTTPLSCIISMLDLIKQRDSIHDFVKNTFVNPALFSSYILLNIVNDLQEKSEIHQSGKVNIVIQSFSLSDLCLECLNFIKIPALQKNIQLEFFSKENVPQIINSDLSKTRQVIINLLTNALKNTQKGNICISLSKPFKNIIQVDVKDSGNGIPTDELKQMFQDLYYSTQQYISKKNKDFNLDDNMSQGLKICYLLSACLGQQKQLTASSEVGKGSVFTFYIKNTKKIMKQDENLRFNSLGKDKNKLQQDFNKLILGEFNKNDKDNENQKIDIKQIFKSEDKSQKNKNMLDVQNKTENQKNIPQKMLDSTDLQSSNISVEDNNIDCNDSFDDSREFYSVEKKRCFLTQNMIKQSQFIYQIVSTGMSQLTNEGSQFGQSTFRSKHQAQQDLVNSKEKSNIFQENTSSNQAILQDKVQILSNLNNTNKQLNLKTEDVNKNNTQTQLKQETDVNFSLFNATIIQDHMFESCNIFPTGSYEKIELNTFIQPRIAQKSFNQDKDQDFNLKNSPALAQSNTPRQIYNNNNNNTQYSQSNNGTLVSNNNTQQNSRRVSQIVLKTEPSIHHSETVIGEQKAQLLYFNVTNGFYVNGDIQNNLTEMNESRQCDCSQILLIDDNDFNLCTLELRLKQYQFVSEKATSGQQALELIKQKSYNPCCKVFTLIFLDIDMPVKNGYEVSVDIINTCNNLQIKIPTISAWTVLLSEKEQQKAIDYGMSYYLTKPLNQQALENVLFEEFILKQKIQQ